MINIYYLYLFLFISCIYSKSINISNENEFKNALNLKYSNIILTSSFSIEENYELSYGDSIIISGISKNISITFNNENNGFLFKEYNYIEINNLTFNGNININNCNDTLISNVNFNGLFIGDILFYQYITFENFEYHNFQQETSDYGLILSNGSFSINNSTFYGSRSILKYILYITVNDIEIDIAGLNIFDSYFSGEYISGILKSIGSLITSENSDYINAVAINGSVFNVYKSILLLKHNNYINNFSYNSGGTFYFDNAYYIENNYFYISNSTALYNGGIIYISSNPNEKFDNIIFDNFIIENIFIPEYSKTSGIIAYLTNNSRLSIFNSQIKNVTCLGSNSCTMADLQTYSCFTIDNVEFNDIKFHNSDGLLTQYKDNFITNVEINNVKMNNIINLGNDISTIISWITNGNLTIN
eukprot:jgi/Orpsp1_1/1187034/evm.model.d7180000054999.1